MRADQFGQTLRAIRRTKAVCCLLSVLAVSGQASQRPAPTRPPGQTPAEASALMKQAQEELQRGKYERAAHDFGTLCRAQSHNALAQLALGLSLAPMGRLQDALIAL